MSPRQVYRCPKHGEFEVRIYDVKEDVPETWICPVLLFFDANCAIKSPWVPSAPNFISGPTTGAKKGD